MLSHVWQVRAYMHELGIAQNILQIVQQSIPEASGSGVRSIRIRVGQLSGVVPDSLDFCFSAIINDTEMKHAKLKIEQVPLTFECKNCRQQFQVSEMEFICPACKSSNLELITGRELEVVEIELADESDGAP
jgi:hydrogenase nickel incorporation protein HypA/HybF